MIPSKFQPAGLSWEQRVQLGGLRAVLDPADKKGRKNWYIDTLQKLALRKYLRLTGCEHVLDLGCGIGRFNGWISNRVAKVWGMDLSLDMLQATKEDLRQQATFVVGSGLNIPFRDESFDLALSIWVLQHIVDIEDFHTTVSEIHRVLRQGSRVFLIEQVRSPSSQHRTRKDYETAFESAGFAKKISVPIRSGRSIPTELATYFPTTTAQTLARIELAYRRLTALTIRETYLDWVFVFKKK